MECSYSGLAQPNVLPDSQNGVRVDALQEGIVHESKISHYNVQNPVTICLCYVLAHLHLCELVPSLKKKKKKNQDPMSPGHQACRRLSPQGFLSREPQAPVPLGLTTLHTRVEGWQRATHNPRATIAAQRVQVRTAWGLPRGPVSTVPLPPDPHPWVARHIPI